MVVARVRPHKAGEGKSRNWNIGAVLNLGTGGMFFYYNRKVELESLLDIQLNFIASASSINCVGKALRVEEAGCPGLFLVAAVFTEVEEEERLKKAVEA